MKSKNIQLIKRAGQSTPDLHKRPLFHNGFTLIELLIVVLIIGILTAVAVPQYKRAVRKTHYKRMLPILTHTAKLQELFFLSNGQYANSFEQLDSDLAKNGPCTYTHPDSTDSINIMDFCLSIYNNNNIHWIETSGLPVSLIEFQKHGNPKKDALYQGYIYLLQDYNSSLPRGLYCTDGDGLATGKDDHCPTTKLGQIPWKRTFHPLQ